MARSTTARPAPEPSRATGTASRRPTVAPTFPEHPSPSACEPPTVDLRIVLFTIADGVLLLCLREAAGRVRLPGGRPRPDESLDAGARRLLRAETGLREEYLEQLYTVGVADDGRWRVIVSYLGLATSEGDAPPSVVGGWSAAAALPPLDESDRLIAEYGARRLRAKLGYTTIAFHLLPETFTLSQLQSAYEVVLGTTLDKRNFRRRVLAADFLTPTGEKRRVGSHRPALLYRFRAAHDHETYLTPDWAEGA